MIYYYIKSFLRSIRKNFFFHGINLTGFIAGIFLLTIIFTFIYQELSFDGFHQNKTSIYRIQSGGYGVTPLCFGEKIRGKIPEVSAIVRFSLMDLELMVNEKEFKIQNAYYVDPGIFQVFSFGMISGNASRALSKPFSIVISRKIAHELYGNMPAVGETVQDKNGTVYTITGIMDDIPYNSHIRSNAFLSIETLRRMQGGEPFNCGSWNNLTYLQLKRHANPRETEAKLNTFLEDSRMETSDGKLTLQLEPLGKIYFDYDNNKFDGSAHGNLQTVVLYFAVSLLILFIVIINFINLSVVISGSRLKQISIQKIYGATRRQVIWQSILESCGVTLISFIISILMIELLLPQASLQLNLSISPSLYRLPLYAYLLSGIFCIGVVTGLLPGIYISGISPGKSLKHETIFHTRGLQRKAFLIIQMAIVATMLNCTLIINRQISYIFTKEMGFQHENIVALYLEKPLTDKNDILKQELIRNHEIQEVSFSDGLIGDGLTKRPVKLDNVEKLCNFISIDPEYLNLYSIRLKYGRNFSTELPTETKGSYLVNEAACKSFGIDNPVGRMIHDKVIVGVVKDFNFSTLHNRIEPLIMSCEGGRAIQIKITGENQQATIDYIHKVCTDILPDAEYELSFLDNRIERLYKPELDLKRSFKLYSLISFFIALLGLFGLMLFQARKMTKEISIRKIHGAGRMDTFRRFTREYVQIIMISNIISVPVSQWAMNKWLAHFQYKAEADPLIFLKTLLITGFFVLLTVSFFIFRVHHTDPLKTLKHE
jgi:putative ABC transport system permease protein